MTRFARPDVPMGATGTLVVLIAAHNEEHAIVATLRAVMAQERVPDRVVVAADNCTDGTVAAARSVPGVTVFETEANSHKKSGALNQAWRRYAADADLVVCIDADTILDPSAVGEWEAEFRADPTLGGCSAKFTMLVADTMTFSERALVRLQRAEFSKWTDMALRRGRRTSVLAGTACAIRNDALRQLVSWRQRTNPGAGPWTHESLVEDFELTYRLREFGWQAKVSATVRAYTDAMTDLRSLWAQRMKWQKGTVNDLLDFGINWLTLRDWWQQAQGLISITVRLLWLVTLFVAVVTHHRLDERIRARPADAFPPMSLSLGLALYHWAEPCPIGAHGPGRRRHVPGQGPQAAGHAPLARITATAWRVISSARRFRDVQTLRHHGFTSGASDLAPASGITFGC